MALAAQVVSLMAATCLILCFSHHTDLVRMADGGVSKRRRLNDDPPDLYLFKPFLEDVPLTSEDGEEDVHITCVEFWSQSLRANS